MSGISPSTSTESFALVTNIMISAPTSSTRLRNVCEKAVPIADLICVVSAVSRDITSPDWMVSKKPGLWAERRRKTSPARSATTRSPSQLTV